MQVPSLGQEDPLEEGMVTLQYSCLEIPRTEEPAGLQSIGSLRVGHDGSDLAHTHTRGRTEGESGDAGLCLSSVQ